MDLDSLRKSFRPTFYVHTNPKAPNAGLQYRVSLSKTENPVPTPRNDSENIVETQSRGFDLERQETSLELWRKKVLQLRSASKSSARARDFFNITLRVLF